jgi:hypothetical protein
MTAKPGLRLGPLPKTEIVRLTFSCSAELKAQLDRYAALLSQVYGVVADPVALIPLMLATFMAKDRVFSCARKSPVER